MLPYPLLEVLGAHPGRASQQVPSYHLHLPPDLLLCRYGIIHLGGWYVCRDIHSLGGGEGGGSAVYFHALCPDPLKCDSSGRRGVVHRYSVPSLNPPPLYAGFIKKAVSTVLKNKLKIRSLNVTMILKMNHLNRMAALMELTA